MKKILHVVNSFDPAGDVARSVRLLKKYSRFQHEVIVKDRHPLQGLLHFEEAPLMGWNLQDNTVQSLFEWCDATIYHFLGAEAGWHEDEKPAAYRNSNSYFKPETGKFFFMPGYSATDFSRYKLLASSHLGAGEFIPNCQFLPALIPINEPQYQPNWTPRQPCFSLSKQHDLFSGELPGLPNNLILKQRFINMPHKFVLEQRRNHATVVLDNISDGHYGLAGMEALALGLPCICFNHEVTKKQIGLLGSPHRTPFVEIEPTVEAVLDAVYNSLYWKEELRRELRQWTEWFYNPARLIEEHWDTFCERLTK